jgi:ribonuclease P protein component
MLSRQHRFHGHNSLRYVYQHGKTVRGPLLALKFVVNERRQTYRAAVVVSRKVSKSAVVRNRIRRRLYELLRHRQDAITQPYDIVITVYSEQVAAMPAQELERVLDAQLKQAGIVAGTVPTGPAS